MKQIMETYYDTSTMLATENSNSESDEMETVVNQAYLEGKISVGLTIWSEGLI